MEDLPTYFDLIVVGTGMPECIIAAAASRVGKKVLHLDRNGYYGGDWASFSYDKFMEFINTVKENCENKANRSLEASSVDLLLTGEEVTYNCPTVSKSITNTSLLSFIRDSSVQEENTSLLSEHKEINYDENESTLSKNESKVQNVKENSVSTDVFVSESMDIGQTWTLQSLFENRRKFNIDLTPKLMFAKGSLVELLISSNIAKYAEFQCISRILTYINGHIEQVPSSRADIFSTKNVSVVEKRMLMKFLKFCEKFEEQLKDIQGFEDKPFIDFLKSKNLTSNIEHYIIHAIAMVDKNCNTIQGLQATKRFLESVGRYGKTPFLFSCYGSAELPQCFCRLCAVYEGIYYLKRQPESIILRDNRLCGIVSMNQRLNCQWLVMEVGYAPPDLFPTDEVQRISRAVLIADSSLYPSDRIESTVMRFPPGNGIEHFVTCIEMSSKNYVCPEDLYLVYLFCQSCKSTAEEDLTPIVDLLYNTINTEKDGSKPNLLWSVYYNQNSTSSDNANAPLGIYLTSSPDTELDYENVVKEAKTIFSAMFPNEEFLPRVPDPEDIIIENSNFGDGAEECKIKNDFQEEVLSSKNDNSA